MFVFKTIKIPHIIKRERHTKRGRVYYKKRQRGLFRYIFNIVGIICIILCVINYFEIPKTEENVEDSFQSYFKVEEGAYALDAINEEKIKNIEFNTSVDSSKAQVIIFQTHFSEEYNEEKDI